MPILILFSLYYLILFILIFIAIIFEDELHVNLQYMEVNYTLTYLHNVN